MFPSSWVSPDFSTRAWHFLHVRFALLTCSSNGSILCKVSPMRLNRTPRGSILNLHFGTKHPTASQCTVPKGISEYLTCVVTQFGQKCAYQGNPPPPQTLLHNFHILYRVGDANGHASRSETPPTRDCRCTRIACAYPGIFSIRSSGRQRPLHCYKTKSNIHAQEARCTRQKLTHVSLLLASDHSKLRTFLEPMATNG